MKKRPLVLILLLLLLLSLTPRDVTAGYGDESSESLTSFSETLPDDVLYYPDSMNLAGSDHYAESFADVSEWIEYWFEAGDSSSTDGDVLSIEAAGDSAGDLDRFYTNDPSFTAEGYMEIRWRVNQTIINYIYFVAWTQDTMSGSTTILSSAPPSDTSWHTQKLYISQAIECVELRISTTAGAKTKFDIDYLRIGPADEMGWQHDGSTTAGVTNDGDTDISYSTSSDGDILTLSAERTAAGNTLVNFYVAYDTTATSIDIERDYYPLFKASVNATVEGGATYVKMVPYLDGYYSVVTLTTDGSFETVRKNTQAYTLTSSLKFLNFYTRLDAAGENFTVELDYGTYYSIANFTVYGAGMAVNDIAYVDSGTLTVDLNAGEIYLGYDPALAVSTITYNIWNITTQTIAPQSAYYVSSWSDYSSETQGPLVSGTLTDLKLNFTTDASLSAIKFIDARDWQEINDVKIIFQVNWSPEFQFGYDAFFIFLGLIMIPVSTMYLARGGRKEMSMDKLFFGLVIFALGFGFLIGGILP